MVYQDSPAIVQTTVVHAQWSDMPEEVVEDVRRLWRNMELYNDFSYYPWGEDNFYDTENPDSGLDEEYRYPALAKYLRNNNIENCLIHWWW